MLDKAAPSINHDLNKFLELSTQLKNGTILPPSELPSPIQDMNKTKKAKEAGQSKMRDR